ncbi:MAG: cation transporter [Opitutales bacterium]|nr:cation transporter [Opitutales bacterium]
MGGKFSDLEEAALKRRVQSIVLCGSAVLLVLKFAAYFITNSMAIFTDAMESIVNVAAGAISLYGIFLASRPKDGDHPFGHGKIELLSASLEAMMIIAAGCLIIYESARRFFNEQPLSSLDVGIAIVAFSGLANFLMGEFSVRMGRRHDSVALVASGKHLKSDTYSTIGLVAGLVAVRLTGLLWLDCAIAAFFGVLILVAGLGILKQTMDNLTDKADEQLLQKMLDAINQSRSEDWINIHNLKIVKYGSFYHVDCDLTLPRFYDIARGHEAYERLKSAMYSKFSNKIQFSIHFDPCNSSQCKNCAVKDCAVRSEPFVLAKKLTIASMTKVEKH